MNKKILIGICGIGNGHINRQSSVIKELLKYNNSIMVVTQKDKIDTIKKRFPNIDALEANIPWIVCNENGIDYKDTLNKYEKSEVNQFTEFLQLSLSIEKKFNGKPDIVITDYEPNVAQYAYSANIPLIRMEQQSKFLYINENKIKNNSIKEEIYRLNYFFPKCDYKIISSFFPIKIKDKNITVTTPIIEKKQKEKVDIKKVLVYFSPYSDSENYTKILNVIKKIDYLNFKIYTAKDIKNYEEYEKHKNLKFLNFNDNFKKELSSCSALLTTGGHQLLSEALELNIPLYVFPLDTYEQKYNALMIEKYNLGIYAKEIKGEQIKEFLGNLNNYNKNIKKYKNKNYKKSWEKHLISVIKKIR